MGSELQAGKYLADGQSASAPSYSFGHTTATGMYSPGANQIRFSTASTDRLTIASDGAVDISGPASHATALTVGNSTGGTELQVIPKENESITLNSTEGATAHALILATGGTPRLTIDASGDVTFTGDGKFTADTNATLTLESTKENVVATDVAGSLNFYANDGSLPAGGRVCGYVRSVAVDPYNRWGLHFGTADYDSTVTDRLVIDNLGNVKIGTGSLAAVGGGPTLGLVGAAPEITLRDSATGTPYAVMRTNDNGNLILEADSGDNAGSSGIEFKVDGATKATIASSGIGYFDVGGINLGDTNLSNYAEGTWTPSVGGDATYSVQSGRYTRVGRLVTATFDMTINVIGTGSTYIVSGLPFNSGDSIGNGGSITYYSSLAVSPVLFAPTVGGSTVHIRSATSAAASPSNHGLLGNGSRIAGIVTYTV